MTLQQLRYAVCIAKWKSMNKAAEELYITQPSLSAAIKELEDEIGFALFFRTNRGVMITPEGEEFFIYARQMVEQYQLLEERFVENKSYKKKFSVSMQHYTFAVDAFITLVQEFGMDDYEFAVHETKTREVIDNVRQQRSELGILYKNDFNEKALEKIMKESDLEFHPLFSCGIYVYLAGTHPLAKQSKIRMEELLEYPCLSFEQGDNNSFYLAEEVFSTYQYKKMIKADDRATLLNLMIGVNGYTLCSGIICENLNGGKYAAVPLETEDKMMIGYIKKRNMPLSSLGEKYIAILRRFEKRAMG